MKKRKRYLFNIQYCSLTCEDKSTNKKYFAALKKSVEIFDQFAEMFTIASMQSPCPLWLILEPTFYILSGLMVQLTPSTSGQKNQDREVMTKGLQEAAVRNMVCMDLALFFFFFFLILFSLLKSSLISFAGVLCRCHPSLDRQLRRHQRFAGDRQGQLDAPGQGLQPVPGSARA